jgi:hypothetical protein
METQTQYEKYKQTIKANSKMYREQNQDKIKEYRIKNKEKLKEYNAVYYADYSKRRKLALDLWQKDDKLNKQLLKQQTKL